MTTPEKEILKKNGKQTILKRYVKFRHSIYGRVVFFITILALFLFVAFGIIFRSVNEKYMSAVIHQTGNNMALLVEGALYHAMLENDRNLLQNTLEIINTMSGVDEVNMYDSENNLVHSSFTSESPGHSNPNCISCHSNFSTMFPKKEKSYKIIDINSECSMNPDNKRSRFLMIHSPILNRKSCYQSSCHAHSPTDEVLGSLVIKIPLEPLDDALAKSSADFFLLVTIATGMLVAFLIIFTRKMIKDPLNDIVKASVAVSHGDTSTRVEIKPNQLDDISMVSRALNQMLDSLQAANEELQNWSQQLEYKVQKKSEELGAAQNELIHIERIASLGKLSLSVAHEINNPLSGILVYTKLVSKQVSNQEMNLEKKENILKHLKLIETETKRCGDIVKGLLDFSKSDQKDYEAAHLHEVLRKTYELMTHAMQIKNINFLTDFSAESDLIHCSANQIKQACVAILVNASEAITENGEIVMRTMNPDRYHIRIEISDNGVGIAPEIISHVFEPFFSTKHNASGIGLGLAIVHGIVQSHKGKIDLKSEPGRGTTFSITFPVITIKD
jgi:two-component system, NtrC family, sensor kinase